MVLGDIPYVDADVVGLDVVPCCDRLGDGRELIDC